MATWMGHLRVAEKLLPHFPDLDPGQFAYGSLAPDFGAPLEDSYTFYPPKEISHRIVKVDEREIVQDLIFFREYLLGEDLEGDKNRYSFLLGYYFHLVCDGLWGSWIGQACKRDHMDMIQELGQEAWWNMKDDWYGIDVQYAQEHRDSIFWTEIMPMADLPLYLDHQDRDAVSDQMKRIQELNSDPPPELAERGEFPYLSKATMRRYVEDAYTFLLEYWGLISNDGIPEGVDSFLELFPEERFLPYPAPLGECA